MSQTKKKPFDLNELESLQRITNLPIVESGWFHAGNFYKRIKTSNRLIQWTLGQAEYSIQSVVDVATPAISIFKGPITSIDQLICKSLDIVEQAVPSISLPPEMVRTIIHPYTGILKKYVADVRAKIVRPVLKRADSVKQIGNNVLASKYTVFAADRLDGALVVAEKYVDKYLPAYDDQPADEVDAPVDGPTGKAIHTIHHAEKFSRKLKRRLTQRTIAEVKALKEQSAEAVHVLIYVAELMVTDPVSAYHKGKELWESLSKDEPENQARPDNLEQLIVLLTRESARKTYQLEDVQKSVAANLKYQAHHIVVALKALNIHITDFLERLAQDLEIQENKQDPKASLSIPQINIQPIQIKNILRNNKQNANGVDNIS
ncbi:hypothetical protein NQ317_003204 [Molorchus minor]|uniref:Lipid storage droplets surface-binding protein 1 n=1 Tax=Molorchus minor TaxID=1323400 RepID=A0ABQ9J941_9CUCU|nr:hypothetical protein NQ317_003204 [Molorchus minor]